MIQPVSLENKFYTNREQSKQNCSAPIFRAQPHLKMKHLMGQTQFVQNDQILMKSKIQQTYQKIIQYVKNIFKHKEPQQVKHKEMDINSDEFLRYICNNTPINYNRLFNINLDSGRLLDIVKSNEPYIYMVNHTLKQGYDANAIKLFNTFLYREYLANSQGAICPKSKVMANKCIIPKGQEEKYKWMGVIPADVSLYRKTKHSQNSQNIKQLSEEIGAGKSSLFIFPEGVYGILRFLPIRNKFQPGTSVIIKKVLEKRDKISVIPLGVAHHKNESAMHIGAPITFTKKDGKYYMSAGNQDSKYFNHKLAKIFKNKQENYLITDQGNPVDEKDIVPYLSGVLAENLECCAKEAKNDLKKQGEILHL